jgi:hypothetical protein
MIFDSMSLNKIESQPLDVWPLMPGFRQKNYSKEYLEKMDIIAAATGSFVPDFAKLHSLFQSEKKLQPPPGWAP